MSYPREMLVTWECLTGTPVIERISLREFMFDQVRYRMVRRAEAPRTYVCRVVFDWLDGEVESTVQIGCRMVLRPEVDALLAQLDALTPTERETMRARLAEVFTAWLEKEEERWLYGDWWAARLKDPEPRGLLSYYPVDVV